MLSCMQGEKSSQEGCMMLMHNAVHAGIRTWCVGGAGAQGGAQGLNRVEHVDAVRTVIQREAQHGG